MHKVIVQNCKLLIPAARTHTPQTYTHKYKHKHSFRNGRMDYSLLWGTLVGICLSKSSKYEQFLLFHKIGLVIKQSLYRSRQASRAAWGRVPKLSIKSLHKSCNVVRPRHRPPLPQEILLVLISVRGWVDPRFTVRLEGWHQLKINDPIGNRKTIICLVGQCLDQLRHRIPTVQVI